MMKVYQERLSESKFERAGLLKIGLNSYSSFLRFLNDGIENEGIEDTEHFCCLTLHLIFNDIC